MNPERPPLLPEPEEEEFSGQILPDATPWKRERISEAQQEAWEQAQVLLEKALIPVDPGIRVNFFPLGHRKLPTLSDPFAAKASPELAVRLGATELMVLKGPWLNRQEFDLKGLKSRLPGIVQDITRKVEERRRGLEQGLLDD